ncbi:MAG: hypothetical protein ACREXM_04935 [Gammaproteobacteria bacterium]
MDGPGRGRRISISRFPHHRHGRLFAGIKKAFANEACAHRALEGGDLAGGIPPQDQLLRQTVQQMNRSPAPIPKAGQVDAPGCAIQIGGKKTETPIFLADATAALIAAVLIF